MDDVNIDINGPPPDLEFITKIKKMHSQKIIRDRKKVLLTRAVIVSVSFVVVFQLAVYPKIIEAVNLFLRILRQLSNGPLLSPTEEKSKRKPG